MYREKPQKDWNNISVGYRRPVKAGLEEKADDDDMSKTGDMMTDKRDRQSDDEHTDEVCQLNGDQVVKVSSVFREKR